MPASTNIYVLDRDSLSGGVYLSKKLYVSPSGNDDFSDYITGSASDPEPTHTHSTSPYSNTGHYSSFAEEDNNFVSNWSATDGDPLAVIPILPQSPNYINAGKLLLDDAIYNIQGGNQNLRIVTNH